ncbi:glycosyltransferase family 47 protein [Hymenobacter cavernae]|uniref:Exostosin GT47 domain-containing protein n=1 Tax=Hymenobacter cavernae TaxID=2044852 RepID=A0ABQ1UJB4_9BACT|nr:glycosyltransferase family 47 protein [Hymenobacter cavernae]GGF20478.1 hypothetical protein GCM10011383_35160 [Hymenobacter cavernae]
MKLRGEEFTNVVANFDEDFWNGTVCCETEYFEKVLFYLKDNLGKSFVDYLFVLYADSWIDKNNMYDFIAAKKEARKIVVLYFSDENSTIPHALMKSGVYAVFKNYMPTELPYPNLFHLPLGYLKTTQQHPITEINQRKINVFFSGALHGTRLKFFKNFTLIKFLPMRYWLSVFHHFKKLVPHTYDSFYPSSYIRFNKYGFRSGMTPALYSEILYNTKIALCPRGILSAETFRHFEAMRAGCIIISEQLPHTFFYQDSPMIFIDDWKQSDVIIKELLSNPSKLADIHQRMLRWWKNVCSEQAIANYIIAKLRHLATEKSDVIHQE